MFMGELAAVRGIRASMPRAKKRSRPAKNEDGDYESDDMRKWDILQIDDASKEHARYVQKTSKVEGDVAGALTHCLL